MSYTNETTHYNIPLPLGSDLTTPMDYNTSMQAVDAALFGAVGDAATATQDASDAKRTAQGAADDVVTLTGRLSDDEATITSQGLAITGVQNGVADVRADLSDAIEAVKEATATAAYAHAVGDLFWYNDTLYRTTTVIAIGDTIVPNTNCTTTTVATELARVESEIPATPPAPIEVTASGSETYGALAERLFAQVDISKVTGNSYIANTSADGTTRRVAHLVNLTATTMGFCSTLAAVSNAGITGVNYNGSTATVTYWQIDTNGNTFNNNTSATATAGYKMEFHYE